MLFRTEFNSAHPQKMPEGLFRNKEAFARAFHPLYPIAGYSTCAIFDVERLLRVVWVCVYLLNALANLNYTPPSSTPYSTPTPFRIAGKQYCGCAVNLCT